MAQSKKHSRSNYGRVPIKGTKKLCGKKTEMRV